MIGSDVSGMLRFVMATLTGVLLATLVTAGTAPDASSNPCDWRTEYETTITGLGEDLDDWRVTRIEDGAWGMTDTRNLTVRVSPDIPCNNVSSIVRHEWMHVQQARTLGVDLQAAYNDPTGLLDELVADCGSKMMGSTYLPYLSQPGWKCNEWATNNARFLISYKP